MPAHNFKTKICNKNIKSKEFLRVKIVIFSAHREHLTKKFTRQVFPPLKIARSLKRLGTSGLNQRFKLTGIVVLRFFLSLSV
jgi:hypothetical protein